MTDNLRDSMATEFDRIQSLDDEAVGLPATEAIEESVEQLAVENRDEKGRFKAKAEKTEPEAPAAETELPDTAVEETPAEEITDQGTEPPAEPAVQPLSPPERWSAEWKAKFTALPREAQQVLLEREGEYDKGFTQKAQEAAESKRRYEPIESVIAPRRQAWAMQGMDEGRAISQLLALSDFAAEKPQEFLTWFASQRGIDIAKLVHRPEAGPALPPEIAPLANEVNSLKQYIQTQKQQQEQAQQQAVVATIEAFKQDPSHPHFDECWNEMSHMIPAIKAAKPLASHTDVLKEAYERATWANPSVRQKFLDTQRAAQEAERAAAETKRAEELKVAEAKRLEQQKLDAAKALKAKGTTIATKAAVGTGKPAPMSLREELSQAYDQLQGVA